MAITELTRIERALRTMGSNAPNLGCGGTIGSAGKDLAVGDYVMVQVYGTTACSLTNVVYNGAPVVSWDGNEAEVLLLQPGVKYYLNLKSAAVTSGSIIAYNRCN